MASGKSDYLEKIILDLVLGAQAYTPPGTVYIALSTAAYADGALTGEPSGGGYARVAVTNNLTNWPAATGTTPSVKSNGTTFTFPTSSSAWGTILSAYVMDAASVGNKLYGGDLTTFKVMSLGDTASFPASSLSAQED